MLKLFDIFPNHFIFNEIDDTLFGNKNVVVLRGERDAVFNKISCVETIEERTEN